MIQSQNKRLTVKQYLKQHPEKYLMQTEESGQTVYVCEPSAGSGLFAVGTTTDREKAIVWSSLDNTEMKLGWHKTKTGLKQLQFVQVQE